MRAALAWVWISFAIAGCTAPPERSVPAPFTNEAPGSDDAPPFPWDEDGGRRLLSLIEGVPQATRAGVSGLLCIETEVVSHEGGESTLLARVRGCAFAPTPGHVVTARRLLAPHEVEPSLAVRVKDAMERGAKIDVRSTFTSLALDDRPSRSLHYPAAADETGHGLVLESMEGDVAVLRGGLPRVWGIVWSEPPRGLYDEPMVVVGAEGADASARTWRVLTTLREGAFEAPAGTPGTALGAPVFHLASHGFTSWVGVITSIESGRAHVATSDVSHEHEEEVDLRARSRARGRVVDRDGRAVRDARVVALAGSTTALIDEEYCGSASTDADGRFELDLLTGASTLFVWPPDGGPEHGPVSVAVVASDVSVDVRLGRTIEPWEGPTHDGRQQFVRRAPGEAPTWFDLCDVADTRGPVDALRGLPTPSWFHAVRRPRSVTELPREDRGVRLETTLSETTSTGLLNLEVRLISRDQNVRTESWAARPPFLAALEADGAPIVISTQGRGEITRRTGLMPLLAAGTEARWRLRLDARELERALPRPLPRVVHLTVAFCELRYSSVQGDNASERRVEDLGDAPPRAVLVRSERLALRRTDTGTWVRE